MENNNQSMNTVIETFYVSETVNLIHDNDALTKWNEKVEELKLSGQKEVVKEDKSPIPFLWMNSESFLRLKLYALLKLILRSMIKLLSLLNFWK